MFRRVRKFKMNEVILFSNNSLNKKKTHEKIDKTKKSVSNRLVSNLECLNKVFGNSGEKFNDFGGTPYQKRIKKGIL